MLSLVHDRLMLLMELDVHHVPHLHHPHDSLHIICLGAKRRPTGITCHQHLLRSSLVHRSGRIIHHHLLRGSLVDRPGSISPHLLRGSLVAPPGTTRWINMQHHLRTSRPVPHPFSSTFTRVRPLLISVLTLMMIAHMMSISSMRPHMPVLGLSPCFRHHHHMLRRTRRPPLRRHSPMRMSVYMAEVFVSGVDLLFGSHLLVLGPESYGLVHASSPMSEIYV